MGKNHKQCIGECEKIVITICETDPLYEDPDIIGYCVCALMRWKAVHHFPMLRKLFENVSLKTV